MEVHFYINENVVKRPEFKAELDSLNVRYKYKEIPGIGNKEGWKYVQFNIAENNPLWPTIRELLDRYGLKAGRRMNYSKRDIETAEWLRLRPDSQSLPPALFTEECEPVTCCEDNEEGQNKPVNRLKPPMTVNQLSEKIESGEVSPFEYDPGDVNWSGIPAGYPCCGRVKYHVIYKHQAKFAREAFKDAPDFVKTNEWFGSGGHAGRETLISQQAARVILENKWRGVQLEPIALI